MRELSALRCDLAAIDLQLSAIKLTRKYRPDQPRVPAGNREGGQWTDGGGSFIPAGFNGPYRPVGNGFIPSTKYNPLDPLKMNRPLSAVEGQRIAGALTAIDSGSSALVEKTEPHPYKNLPHLRLGPFCRQAMVDTKRIVWDRAIKIAV